MKRIKWRWGALLVAFLVALSIAVPSAETASALSGSEFDPGYIISDANFYNSNAMSQSEIQNFLNSNIGTCQNSLCLNVLRVDSSGRAADRTVCSAYAGSAQELASSVIFKVQQACGISAKVILVTLQKEQGLISNTRPSEPVLARAMGYACPDSTGGTCDSKYYGFYNQVYWAAWQLKRYSTPDRFGAYQPGPVSIAYGPPPKPPLTCPAPVVVNIQNNATAALYNYTPYQPNAAALANLGGVGDSCSSYGNRNFWVFYNNWFGSPAGNINPFGAVDSVVGVAGAVHVQGWAMDLDTTAAIPVHVYIDGVGTAITANQARSDVGAIYPSQGPNHGFSADIPVSNGGTHQVCIFGINIGPGSNTQLGPCWTAVTKSGAPFGVIDNASGGNGKVTASGWAIDPDSASPVTLGVSLDGVSSSLAASGARADVALAYPGYGPNHAFSISLDASSGSHTLCITMANVGPGSDVAFGCRTVTVDSTNLPELGRAPFGVVDSVVVGASSVTVSGWAIDPDTAASVRVHVYVDASGTNIAADGARADVAAAYPGYGANHAYSATVPAPPGTHTLCIYAINAGPGPSNTPLTCRQISVPYPPGTFPELGRAPFGVVDSVVVGASSVTVSGWAIDPDTAASVRVHVYVDASGTNIAADGARADVAAAYPGYGANHAYSATVPAPPGTHTLCIYAINAGPGPSNTPLTCRQISVP